MMNIKLVKHLLFTTLLPAYFCMASISHAAGFPAYVEGQPLPSLAPMLERSMPAVVNISTSTNIQISENPLMQDPFFLF